ncbi:hypothetical protein D1007_58418 [Hordeum vulgare]|nr:hypothetical protein D1007_58418 [Hordeum vulgare]
MRHYWKTDINRLVIATDGFTLGTEKATTLNTYTVMKCGMKNVSSNGNNGAIISNGAVMSQKAKQRLDDYTTLAKKKYPDSWEGRELDELRHAKEMLQQKVDMHGQLITALFKEIGKELPAHILHILSHGAVSQPEGTNNSSQAGSRAVDGNNDVMGSSEENDATGDVDVDQTVDATSHGQTTR